MPDYKRIHPKDYRRLRSKTGRSHKRINRLYQRVLDGKVNLTWLRPLTPDSQSLRRTASKKRK